MSNGRRWRVDTALGVIVLVPMALVVCPSAAFAQRDVFVEAVVPFYRALAGVYGDEGPQVAAQLEALAAALSRWDRALAATEITQRARLEARDMTATIEAHTVLASLYAERGQLGNAVREAEEAVRADPTRSALHRFKALLYQAAGRPADAASAFRDAWLVEPGDVRNAYHLVVHRSTQTTLAELERALRTLADVERQFIRGQIALQAELRMRDGDYEGAIPLWGRVIELEDTSATNHLRLAESLTAVGRFEDAVVSIQMAISRKAGPDAHRRLADAYGALGRNDESVRERGRYVELRLQELRAAAGEATPPGR